MLYNRSFLVIRFVYGSGYLTFPTLLFSFWRHKRKEKGCFLVTWLLLLLSLGHTVQRVGSYFPDQGSNLCPLHCPCRVLTTGSSWEVPGRVFKDWQHWLCPDLDVLYFTSHLILVRVYFPTFQIQSWGWEKWSLLDKITHLQKFQSQDLNPGLTLKPMVLTRVFSCLTEGNELDLTYRSETKWKGDREKWKPTVWGFMLWLEYVG